MTEGMEKWLVENLGDIYPNSPDPRDKYSHRLQDIDDKYIRKIVISNKVRDGYHLLSCLRVISHNVETKAHIDGFTDEEERQRMIADIKRMQEAMKA